jgi:MtN3 and saliva related transmembrane protein
VIPSVTWIGIIAGTCTTLSFLPQVIKAWASRSTADISLLMFTVLTIGTCLWLLYGVLIADIPVIAANGVTLVFVGAILVCKVKYG